MIIAQHAPFQMAHLQVIAGAAPASPAASTRYIRIHVQRPQARCARHTRLCMAVNDDFRSKVWLSPYACCLKLDDQRSLHAHLTRTDVRCGTHERKRFECVLAYRKKQAMRRRHPCTLGRLQWTNGRGTPRNNAQKVWCFATLKERRCWHGQNGAARTLGPRPRGRTRRTARAGAGTPPRWGAQGWRGVAKGRPRSRERRQMYIRRLGAQVDVAASGGTTQ